MAKPIAGINDYPYGVCGYVVDGAFINGSKHKNLRIYKQRSDVMFDLIDPGTGTIYRKLLITGINTQREILDYAKSNDEILNEIPKNTFFVRGYNDSKTIQGFAIRFLLNKIILSTGRALYDIYTPTCTLPLPNIDNIVVSPITVNDTEITGVLTSSDGAIDTTDMVVTITLPDGSEHIATVNPDGTFILSPVDLSTPGTVTITITSPKYNDASTTVQILDDDEDSDYVIGIQLQSTDFVADGDEYVATVPASLHMKGTDLVVQLHETSGDVYFSTVNVVNGDITIRQNSRDAVQVVIIGSTLKTTPYSGALVWTSNGDGTSSASIPKSVHQKENISFSVYDSNYIVTVEAVINADEDLVLTSNEEFAGTIVIAGKP